MRLHYNYKDIIVLSNCRIRTCDPTGGFATMGVLMAVGGGLAATSAYQSGQDAKSASSRQADMYNQQAANLRTQQDIARKTADQNITATQLQASQEAKQLAQKVGAVEGAQKAGLAASGIGGGSVTAADILTDTFDKSKLDEIAIRYNADSRSEEYENNARNNIWSLGSEAKQYESAAKNANIAGGNYAKAGNISAAKSILDTATSMSSNYLKYNSSTSPRALSLNDDEDSFSTLKSNYSKKMWSF